MKSGESIKALLQRTVVICGSTRFCDEQYRDSGGMTPWQRVNYEYTLASYIVLTIGVDFKSDAALELTAADKERLDILHLDKVKLAGIVYVLNVDGYIGESTRREIRYAMQLRKEIRWHEEPNEYTLKWIQRD
jgi:hypothetical protein